MRDYFRYVYYRPGRRQGVSEVGTQLVGDLECIRTSLRRITEIVGISLYNVRKIVRTPRRGKAE